MIYYRKEKLNITHNYKFCLEDGSESGRNFKYNIRDGQMVRLGPGKKERTVRKYSRMIGFASV